MGQLEPGVSRVIGSWLTMSEAVPYAWEKENLAGMTPSKPEVTRKAVGSVSTPPCLLLALLSAFYSSSLMFTT